MWFAGEAEAVARGARGAVHHAGDQLRNVELAGGSRRSRGDAIGRGAVAFGGGERERYKQGKDGHEDQGLEALHERDSIDGFPAHIPQGEGAGASSRGMGTLVALQEKRKGLSQVLPCRQ